MKKYLSWAIGTIVLVAIVFYVLMNFLWTGSSVQEIQAKIGGNSTPEVTKNLIVAGGCFWCVEADMEKAKGVVEAISGYSGGTLENPTYENYAQGGHREVARVIYNPKKTGYRALLQYFLKHIDPTDGKGQFVDRGFQYSPAIYYETPEEKRVANAVLQTLDESGVFSKPLQVPVLPQEEFYKAEKYHQDYYKKNPLRYSFYRSNSGRDDFLEKYWSGVGGVFPDPSQFDVISDESKSKTQNATTTLKATEDSDAVLAREKSGGKSWLPFTMPSEEELREMLTPLQYAVTREAGTETPFKNPYYDNIGKEGIYVDIVSGAPLFSSKNIFHSGTGWPSYTAPLEPDNIVLKPDYTLLGKRIEVVSKSTGNHLGHVFEDGPTTLKASGGAKPTGLRYCLNSAALEFIPADQLEERGYEKYADLFD